MNHKDEESIRKRGERMQKDESRSEWKAMVRYGTEKHRRFPGKGGPVTIHIGR